MKILTILITFIIINITNTKIIIPIGGSLLNGSPILNIFQNKTVAFITAAE
jgi:hypothetical protein